MEELTHLQASRKGVRLHVTRLYNKIDGLLDGETDEYSIILTNIIAHLNTKKDKLAQIDEQIAPLIGDPKTLEENVMEAEAI